MLIFFICSLFLSEITKINIARSPLFTIDKDQEGHNEDVNVVNVNLKVFLKNCKKTEKTRKIGLVLVPVVN